MAQQPASSETGMNARLCTGSRAASYAAGRVLAGRYRIEGLIGMGAMGVVLAARHIELDTRVAIKAILPEMQSMPGVLSLFAREARAAVAIRSEHVARVFDVGMDGDLGPYIVMEYLEGRDLRAILLLDGCIPLQRAIDYILQACEALAAAHAKKVIHRDIKPENLFLTRQGDMEIIKLLDFGVSKAAITGRLFGGDPSARATTGFMGTPLYMSPEQIHSRIEVDQRTDIWSLGALLYELLAGRSAFSSKDGMPALLNSICKGAPPPLSEFCSEPEVRLQGVIDQCLDKNPARRFQNVAELAYALVPFATSRSRVHAQRAASILGTRAAAEGTPVSARPAQPSPKRPSAPGLAGWRKWIGVRAPAVLRTQREHRRQGARAGRRYVAGRPLLVGALVLGAVLLGPHTLPRAGLLAEVLSQLIRVDSQQRSAAAEPVASPAPAAPAAFIERAPSSAGVGSGAAAEPAAREQALAEPVRSTPRKKPSNAATRRAKLQPGLTAKAQASAPSGIQPGAAVAPASGESRLRLVDDTAPPRRVREAWK